MEKGGAEAGVVHLKEYFIHTDKEGEHMCLVFETLGKSLYDFIKLNKYKGYSLTHIQSIARQSLKALAFLHDLGLTHTDLKPENILLKYNDHDLIYDKGQWPAQVLLKRDLYGP
jgi:dual-specificity kinase